MKNVFGRTFSQTEVQALSRGSSLEKCLAILVRNVDVLETLRMQAGVTTLRSGVKALAIKDETWGPRIVITEPVDMMSKILIDMQEYTKKRTLPSAIMDGMQVGKHFPRMCSIVPTDKDGRLIPFSYTAGGVERSTCFVPIPAIGTLVTPMLDAPGLGEDISGMQLIKPVLGDLLQVSNVLSRDGEYTETEIRNRMLGTDQWIGQLKRLWPNEFKDKKGNVRQYWNEIASSLTGKHGAFRAVRDVRVKGGASLILLADCRLGHLECRIPRAWATEVGLDVGDYCMLSRRPALVTPTLRVVGFSRKGVFCNPRLIEDIWISDCDGDLVQVWPIPRSLPGVDAASETVRHRLEQAVEPAEKEDLFDPPAMKADPIGDALQSMLKNKLMMGPVSALRFYLSLFNEFKAVELGRLEFDTTKYEQHLGRPLVRPEGKYFAVISLFHDIAEQAINKRADINFGALKDMLNLAKVDPHSAWKSMMALDGPIASHPDLLVYWCEYLHTLPCTVTEYLTSRPQADSRHEASFRQELGAFVNSLED